MRFFAPLIFVFQILIAQDIFQSAEIVIEAFGERLETKTHLTPYLFDIAKNGHLLDSEKKEELKSDQPKSGNFMMKKLMEACKKKYVKPRIVNRIRMTLIRNANQVQ